MKISQTFLHHTNDDTGFIAVTAVLVLSALFLSVSLGITHRSVGTTQMSITNHHSNVAKALAHACAESGLMSLTRNLHYLGSETLVLSKGSCNIEEIIEETDGTRTLRTVGNTSGHLHRIVVEIEEVSPSIVVSSYQSVMSF